VVRAISGRGSCALALPHNKRNKPIIRFFIKMDVF